jgi:signal transduction histidine kinase
VSQRLQSAPLRVDPLSAPVLRRFAAILAPMLALLALGVAGVNARERAADLALAKRASIQSVSLQVNTISRAIAMVSSIVLYLGEERSLTRFLSGDAERGELEANYRSICKNARMFHRVRLLDLAGGELVRVDADGDAPVAAPPGDLGPGADPELAARAAELGRGQVYVSRFELARPAPGEAEPWKPVLHFAVLAYGADQRPLALLVLDYIGDSILRFVQQTGLQVQGWTALVDRDGHFLGAPAGESSWTGVLGARAGFADHHPRAWEELRGETSDWHLDELGLYVHGLVPTPRHREAALSDLDLAVVCHVPREELYAQSRNTLRILLAGGAGVAVILTAVAWRLAHAASVRIEHERRLADSERGLRKLSARLIEAQEEERRRISRDLHDELGQQATAIAILQKRALRSDDDAQRRDLLGDAIAATDSLLAGVHRIATSLRTTILDDLGLAAALRAACADAGERSGLAALAELDFDDRELAPDLAQAVYRLVQEGLTNAQKHARAKELRVSVKRDDGRLLVEIRDDGVGFDPRAPHDRLGLLGMRERVEQLGGLFRCESEPGAGTRLSASFPISASPDQVTHG